MFKWLFNRFRRGLTITVYMKSGNVIVLKRLRRFSLTRKCEDVTNVEWELLPGTARIYHLDLTHIEAVVRT
jgi:hypothetical protein